MTLVQRILRSTRFPSYVSELTGLLDAERERRERFFDDLREDEKAEFINGEVIVHSPVANEHEIISSFIFLLMTTYVNKHAIGRVAHEKMLVSLTRNDYEPDICFFNNAKADQFTRRQMKFPAPDLIVEVLSPSTEKVDRTIKFEDYAAHGVAEYWIVDPAAQTIQQHFLAKGVYAPAKPRSSGAVASRVISGLKFPIRAAFDAKANLRALKSILG